MATLWGAMVRRFVVGLVLGLLVGAALAAALVAGLKIRDFTSGVGVLLGYGSAALVGMLTGLVAGKPIWAGNAKVEGALKALFGAALGVGGMFAMRQWAGGVVVDLGAIGAGGPASVGALPAVALPAIGAVLGIFFELDNTGDASGNGGTAERKRVDENRAARPRLQEDEGPEADDEGELSLRSKH